MRFGIFFSLLLSCSAFANATPKGDLPKAKAFKCKYDRAGLVLAGLKMADSYVNSIRPNPQFQDITVMPGVELNRLAETEFYDFTLVVPIRIQSTEGMAMVISIYPSDEFGHSTAFEDLVIPFSIEETGPKKKCGIRSGFDSAVAAEKSYLVPSFKVMTIGEKPIVLDDKRTIEVSQ